MPCPVCVGVQMEKVRLRAGVRILVLDHCPRCGGVWFEKGEAQQLTQLSPIELWKHVPPRQDIPRPPCHGCNTPLDRDAERCDVCRRKNELSCPVCDRTMERRVHDGLVLDVCASCRGVWFDHKELKHVWQLSLNTEAQRRSGRGSQALAVGGEVMLESLFWAPDLVLHAGAAAASGVGEVVGAIGGVSLEGAAHAAMGAAEVVGGAAEGVFSFIVEIIGSLFDS
jgi:Zn-finger nucleic acid-binding protein